MSDEEPDPPRAWVAAFHDSEAEVRGVLDDAREDHLLGDTEAVRERLRAFAGAEPGVFRLVALSVVGGERLFDDLADQYDDGAAPVEELRALGDAYDRLAGELELVLSEQLNDLRNPMPGVRRGFRYSEAAALPRLDYDLYSGEVELCRFVHPPSQALLLARSVVGSTRELLEQVEAGGDPVAEAERERLAAVFEDLAAEVEGLAEHVEDADGEETTDLAAYDDRSFY